MSEKYKIGEISKLLGIPIQTLHYYEKCGFVTPQKDKSSHYRYYDAWDVNYLLDSKYLRSFNFSNAEIEKIINNDSIEGIKSRFSKQEERLIELIYHYQNVLDVLHSEQSRLSKFANHIGTFTEMNSPQIYFLPYRIKNSYQILEGGSSIPRIDEWLSHMPFITATFKLSHDGIVKGKPESLVYLWGFSVSTKRAKELTIPTQNAEYIPSLKCLYTVFSAHDQNTFARSLCEQVLDPLWSSGYEISDSPIGRLIVRAHEDGEYTRYFEIWIPVQ